MTALGEMPHTCYLLLVLVDKNTGVRFWYNWGSICVGLFAVMCSEKTAGTTLSLCQENAPM